MLGKERTELFEIFTGVKQGCILSPILFSIFVNTLAKEIEKSGIGIEVNGDRIAILMYADDIVLVASSEEDLKRGMKIATEWGKKWNCSFNQDKSKVVVFGQKKKGKAIWTLGGKEIEQVDTYKYLGLDLKGNLKWNMMRDRLAGKTRRNMDIAWAMGIQSGHLSVVAADMVWKVLVRPIAEYGAEVWGEDRWDEMEKIQRDMGKRILGLEQSTCNEVILGEMGWWTMKARRDMLRLRYWRKLLKMDRKRIPRKVYDWEMGRTTKKRWCTYTKSLLMELGLGEKWLNQAVSENGSEWNKLIEERIQQREERRWGKRIKEKPKLRTYRLVKTKLTFEEYLKTDDVKGRRLLTRLRSGTNFLRIETGRREGLNSGERNCWFGCDATEDERHFLMECHMYEDLREDFRLGEGEGKLRTMELGTMLGNCSKEMMDLVRTYVKRAEARRRRILDNKENDSHGPNRNSYAKRRGKRARRPTNSS